MDQNVSTENPNQNLPGDYLLRNSTYYYCRWCVAIGAPVNYINCIIISIIGIIINNIIIHASGHQVIKINQIVWNVEEKYIKSTAFYKNYTCNNYLVRINWLTLVGDCCRLVVDTAQWQYTL